MVMGTSITGKQYQGLISWAQLSYVERYKRIHSRIITEEIEENWEPFQTDTTYELAYM